MPIWVACACHPDEPPLVAVSTRSAEEASNRLVWALMVRTQGDDTGWRVWPAQAVSLPE
jgi:hypothetical protein